MAIIAMKEATLKEIDSSATGIVNSVNTLIESAWDGSMLGCKIALMDAISAIAPMLDNAKLVRLMVTVLNHIEVRRNCNLTFKGGVKCGIKIALCSMLCTNNNLDF